MKNSTPRGLTRLHGLFGIALAALSGVHCQGDRPASALLERAAGARAVPAVGAPDPELISCDAWLGTPEEATYCASQPAKLSHARAHRVLVTKLIENAKRCRAYSGDEARACQQGADVRAALEAGEVSEVSDER